jgi:hypothetical protein
MRRPIRGHGRFTYGMHEFHSGAAGPRPGCSGTVAQLAPMPTSLAGPVYKGMDPSDPLTYVRAWNPQPGMIAFLNFDGAQMQSRTPTQLQRGSQARHRRLRISG